MNYSYIRDSSCLMFNNTVSAALVREASFFKSSFNIVNEALLILGFLRVFDESVELSSVD